MSSSESEEVATAFKESLAELSANNKFEIMTLTQIAMENVEHALAISKVLETHIKTTQPIRKLPALYVLDSICKNIGSPYTVYLSRNLFSTFMEAYRMVDPNTRKNMEAMLRTWREPVPNSTDPKPVFNVDVVKAVETALMKARVNAAQEHHQQAQRQFQSLPARPTNVAGQQWGGPSPSTPPQFDPRYGQPPPMQGAPTFMQQPPYGQQAYASPPPQVSQMNSLSGFMNEYSRSQQPTPPQHFFPQPPLSMQPPYQPPQNLATPKSYYHHLLPPNPDQALMSDVEALISNVRDELSRRPHDQGLQTKHKALVDLETIIRSQQLSPDQKAAVVDQVNRLKLADQQQRPPSVTPLMPPTPQLPFLPPANSSFPPPPPIQPPPTSTSLADLLRQATQTRTATPPTPHLAPPPPPNLASLASALNAASSAPGPEPNGGTDNSLLASLRAAGLLSSDASQPPRPSSSTPQLPFAAPPSLASLASALAGAPAESNEVQLTSASIRVSRPHLLKTLYTARPSQCATCGRRFEATPEGKSRKARHLDFHFRTNQRMADAARRGVTRSWFVGEMEWIRFREVDDGDEAPSVSADGETAGGGGGAAGAAAAGAKAKKARFIKALTGAQAAQPCSICQEKFDSVWSDEVQDWVWMDAVLVGGRPYHASCYDEATKHAPAPAARPKSPGASVLGKRKAEGEDGGSKLKRELVA